MCVGVGVSSMGSSAGKEVRVKSKGRRNNLFTSMQVWVPHTHAHAHSIHTLTLFLILGWSSHNNDNVLMIIGLSMLSHTYQRHSSLFHILIKHIKTMLLAIYYCYYFYRAYTYDNDWKIQHVERGIRVFVKRIIFMHVPALGNTHTHAHTRMPTYSLHEPVTQTFWMQNPTLAADTF